MVNINIINTEYELETLFHITILHFGDLIYVFIATVITDM